MKRRKYYSTPLTLMDLDSQLVYCEVQVQDFENVFGPLESGERLTMIKSMMSALDWANSVDERRLSEKMEQQRKRLEEERIERENRERIDRQNRNLLKYVSTSEALAGELTAEELEKIL